MNKIIFALMAIFVVVAVTLLVRAIHRLVLEYRHSSTSVGDLLLTISGNSDARTKGEAFVQLMELSYVLVHTIVNAGNKYNDRIQSESFCDSLTSEAISRLNKIGEYHGQHTR